MFGSSLPRVVWVLFQLSVLAYAKWCPTHIVLCFLFLFSFSSSCVRYFASFTGLSIVGSLFGNLLRLSKTKRDDFYFAIINVSHLEINIPIALAYGVNIVQLVR
jgi:hypothetical protein